MKVLVVGSGGREHTLAWACTHSKLQPSVTCVPGNGGTAQIARNVNISAENISEIVDFVRDQRFDLTIVGPEAPLVTGLVDKLAAYGYRTFGPSISAARIEGSKAFAKKMMAELGLPTAEFKVFSDMHGAENYLRQAGEPIVVKASGLAAGKGALVCETLGEALAAAEGMLVRDAFGQSGREIVIEKRLYGKEMSLLAIVDGTDYLLLPPSRDHKRARDNDKGPNTGGMGAYSPLPDLDDNQVSEIAGMVFPPVLNRLAEIGSPYSGCLYAGVILTEDGPQVLEFNCRFGDPEAQAVLPLLTDDLLEIMAETAEGSLGDWMDTRELNAHDWKRLGGFNHAVSVVAASDGYPGSYRKGIKIESLPLESDEVIPFHAGTVLHDNELYTSGGRVLAITGVGATMEKAVDIAYNAIDQVQFEGVTYRRDIGRLK